MTSINQSDENFCSGNFAGSLTDSYNNEWCFMSLLSSLDIYISFLFLLTLGNQYKHCKEHKICLGLCWKPVSAQESFMPLGTAASSIYHWLTGPCSRMKPILPWKERQKLSRTTVYSHCFLYLLGFCCCDRTPWWKAGKKGLFPLTVPGAISPPWWGRHAGRMLRLAWQSGRTLVSFDPHGKQREKIGNRVRLHNIRFDVLPPASLYTQQASQTAPAGPRVLLLKPVGTHLVQTPPHMATVWNLLCILTLYIAPSMCKSFKTISWGTQFCDCHASLSRNTWEKGPLTLACSYLGVIIFGRQSQWLFSFKKKGVRVWGGVGGGHLELKENEFTFIQMAFDRPPWSLGHLCVLNLKLHCVLKWYGSILVNC